MRVLRVVAGEWDSIAFALGFGALVVGVALVYVPAAFILAGAVLMALPFLAGRSR